MCRALKSFTQTTISLVALMILFVFTATAQSTTASITGRVVDGLGNVVPNATVTATFPVKTKIERCFCFPS